MIEIRSYQGYPTYITLADENGWAVHAYYPDGVPKRRLTADKLCYHEGTVWYSPDGRLWRVNGSWHPELVIDQPVRIENGAMWDDHE